MADSMNKELFLDILTKDEREALLTKKMEEIRKKNEALRKRHEEIEADKRVAAKESPSLDVNSYSRDPVHSGPASPRKEFKPPPGEEKRGPRPPKSGGRGRPQSREKPKEKRSQGLFRVIRWEPHTGEVDITGEDSAPDGVLDTSTPQSQAHRHTQDDSPTPRGQADRRTQDTGPTPRGQADRRTQDTGPTPQGQADQHTQDAGPTTRGQEIGDNTDVGHQAPDSETASWKRARPKRPLRIPSRSEDTGREDVHSRLGPTYHHTPRRSGKLGPEDGPPPDPTYNFLVDRRREGGGVGGGGVKESSSHQDHPGDRSPRKGESRRHPKNYGGPDFNNVKAQLRTSKERQERPKSGPPRTKMELAMSMTGRERKQYMEWKAERERVDLERLERQKSNTGEWRRAWDADKHQQDFEQPSSPQRTEPAKRPAGRIGSGRFDRGEREERHRGDAPRQKAGVKVDQETQHKPVGRGRARGRGRGRGRCERSPRQRTSSSGDESRKVERQKDLLVVKIDNSGKDSDHTVEVEYWDEDGNDVRSNSATSGRSGTSHSSHSNQHGRQHGDSQFEDPEEGQDGGYVGSHRRHTHSQSLGDENEHDESWEDCPEDAEFYADDYTDGDEYNEPLKLECKLNPDAPEFTPTSPDFMKTPPGHVKVMDWVTEVNSNLSPTSPPPTMGGVNNEECKKALFKKDSPKKSDKEQKSSTNGGVADTSKETLEEETISSKTEEKGLSVAAAPEAADEFLDASGNLEEEEEDKTESPGTDDIVKKSQEQPEETESQPDVIQHETCSNGNTEKVNTTEKVVIVDEKATNDKEELSEENISVSDNVGTDTVLTDEGITESCNAEDNTNTAEVLSSSEVAQDAGSDEMESQEQSAQPSPLVQMAKSEASSQGELVNSAQDSHMVQDADQTGHEKSSLSETETVDSTDPAVTTVSKESAADSNVG